MALSNYSLNNPENELLMDRLSFLKSGEKTRVKQVSYYNRQVLTGPYLQPIIGTLNATKNGSKIQNRVGLVTRAVGADIKVECAYQGNQYSYQVAQSAALLTQTAPYYDYVRFMLIWDNQPNQALPTVDEIITDLDSNGKRNMYGSPVPTEHPFAPLPWAKSNLSNLKRFFVIRDLPLTLSDPTPALAIGPSNIPPAPPSGLATNGSGSSSMNYHKRFIINFADEMARKDSSQTNITQYNYDPNNINNNYAINTGALIYMFYTLKPNTYFQINSTVYFTDR